MIAPGGLLLILPTFLQSLFQFYGWGCKKVNNLNLDVRNIFVAIESGEGSCHEPSEGA